MTTTQLVRRTSRARSTQRDQRGWWGDLEDQGLTAHVETVIERKAVPADIGTHLDVEPGTELLVRSRHMAAVVDADMVPLQLASTWFPPVVSQAVPQLAEQDTGAGGYLARLEDLGHVLDQRYITKARLATDEEVEALRLEEPVVFTETWIVRDKETGTPLAATKVIAAGERNEFIYGG